MKEVINLTRGCPIPRFKLFVETICASNYDYFTVSITLRYILNNFDSSVILALNNVENNPKLFDEILNSEPKGEEAMLLQRSLPLI